MSSIRQRSTPYNYLNLEQFKKENNFSNLGPLGLICNEDRQYILRKCIRFEYYRTELSEDLLWLQPMLDVAKKHQRKINSKHRYCYITVRHGLVESETDDEWHVDGFSMKSRHLPEQNYVWSNCYPTEYVLQRFEFPKDFDPLKHNIHKYFQDRITAPINTLSQNTVYCIDPYIIHRRPQIPEGTRRTFVRISFTPIPIRDVNNTPSEDHRIPTFKYDGIKDFRDKLITY